MKPYLLKNEELKELASKIRGWGVMSTHIERAVSYTRLRAHET